MKLTKLFANENITNDGIEHMNLEVLDANFSKIDDEGIEHMNLKFLNVEDFSSIALGCYKEIAKGDDYILTGKWLETLARKYGMHPITARNRLDEARQAGYLERYTEGSTPETQFEKHTMHYLKLSHGLPVVEKINLYHGDFLIQDRASVSIRIEGK